MEISKNVSFHDLSRETSVLDKLGSQVAQILPRSSLI